MNARSTADSYVHFQGDVVSNVNSSHGVQLTGGSTGGVVQSFGDDANISLTVRGKGTGGVTLGNSSNPVAFAGSSVAVTSTHVKLNSTRTVIGANSTTAISGIQRYFVEFTVPALSSAGSAVSTVTVAGLTTNSILILQPRGELNSTVTGVWAHGRCSTANSLAITFVNNSISTLSGSTQSAYLLQIAF